MIIVYGMDVDSTGMCVRVTTGAFFFFFFLVLPARVGTAASIAVVYITRACTEKQAKQESVEGDTAYILCMRVRLDPVVGI